MMLEKSKQLDDLRSIIALHNDYCTAETFMRGDYDLRIQKIGDRHRVFKRTGVSGGWKTNVGSAILEEIPLTSQYKSWSDHAAKLFGGLDMFALDSIHTLDGKDIILELNGSSIGLGPEREIDDNQVITDLVLSKLLLYHDKSTKEEKVDSDKKEIDNKLQELEVEVLNLKNQNHRLENELEQTKQSINVPTPRIKAPKKSELITYKHVSFFLSSFLLTIFLSYIFRKIFPGVI